MAGTGSCPASRRQGCLFWRSRTSEERPRELGRLSTKPHGGTRPRRGGPQRQGLRPRGDGGGRGETQVAGEAEAAPAGIPALAGAVPRAAGAGGIHAGPPGKAFRPRRPPVNLGEMWFVVKNGGARQSDHSRKSPSQALRPGRRRLRLGAVPPALRHTDRGAGRGTRFAPGGGGACFRGSHQ
jgi:hypothetical protein